MLVHVNEKIGWFNSNDFNVEATRTPIKHDAYQNT